MVPNQKENGKYNLISGWFDKIYLIDRHAPATGKTKEKFSPSENSRHFWSESLEFTGNWHFSYGILTRSSRRNIRVDTCQFTGIPKTRFKSVEVSVGENFSHREYFFLNWHISRFFFRSQCYTDGTRRYFLAPCSARGRCWKRATHGERTEGIDAWFSR